MNDGSGLACLTQISGHPTVAFSFTFGFVSYGLLASGFCEEANAGLDRILYHSIKMTQ